MSTESQFKVKREPNDNFQSRPEKIQKIERARDRGLVHQGQLGRGFQCNWCKRILQNENGLTRHKHFCGYSPAMKNTGKCESSFNII